MALCICTHLLYTDSTMVRKNKRMKVRYALYAVVLGITCLALFLLYWKTTNANKPICPRCNIVMIDIDILRADALPCNGYKRNTTPNICAFGSSGQMFLNNYTQSNWTLPSMFSTITSMYPAFHGVTASLRDSLDPKIPTLAQTLKGAGYRTYYFGTVDQTTITDANGGTKGYDAVQSQIGIGEWSKEIEKLSHKKQPFFAHFYTPRLHMPYVLENESQFMEQIYRPTGFPVTPSDLSQRVGNYLFQNYKKVFTSLALSDRPDLFEHMDSKKIPALVEYYLSQDISDNPQKITRSSLTIQYQAYMTEILKDESLSRPFVRLLYDSALAIVDGQMAEVFSLVSLPEYVNNTIVVLYSDHGEAFGERGFYSHPEALYNEIIHTPLMIYIPKVRPQKIQNVTQNIDIFPTVLSLIGHRWRGIVNGTSLVPMLTGTEQLTGELTISQAGTNKISVSDGTWKLILNNATFVLENAELYNLLEDSDERNNLISDRPDMGKLLFARLRNKIPYE